MARVHWELLAGAWTTRAARSRSPCRIRSRGSSARTYSPAPTAAAASRRAPPRARRRRSRRPGEAATTCRARGARRCEVVEMLEERERRGHRPDRRAGHPARAELARGRQAGRPARGARAAARGRLRPPPLRGPRRLRPAEPGPRRLGVRARAADRRRDRADRASPGDRGRERVPVGAARPVCSPAAHGADDVERGRAAAEPRRRVLPPRRPRLRRNGLGGERRRRRAVRRGASTRRCCRSARARASRSARRCEWPARRSGSAATTSARSGRPTSTTAIRRVTRRSACRDPTPDAARGAVAPCCVGRWKKEVVGAGPSRHRLSTGRR